MRFARLEQWLEWQLTLHPRAIDLGLERVRAVAHGLGLLTPSCPVITVAGTNGKGSSVAFLEAMLGAAGYRVGSYTSPHLLRYNERIRIDGREVDDQTLIEAFDRVDRARGELSLSYFEFGTLAALDIFSRSGCGVWVLEVGLGGRLDAVNVIDADAALIASVGLDHTDWLGPDREAIGAEKAGVLRPGRAAVFGQVDVPRSVRRLAEKQGATLRSPGDGYAYEIGADGRWSFAGQVWTLPELPAPVLPGRQQYANAAAALAVLEDLRERLTVPEAAIAAGLRRARLVGRLQILPGAPEWMLDVAHNHDSVQWLAQALQARPRAGRTYAVLAQMRRKAADAVIEPLVPLVDGWLLIDLPDADARPAAEMRDALATRVPQERILDLGSAADVFARAQAQAGPEDRIVVYGSFRTVEEALRWHAASPPAALADPAC